MENVAYICVCVGVYKYRYMHTYIPTEEYYSVIKNGILPTAT